MGRKLAENFSVAVEEVAREYALEIGFDMETEHHALFRMMMCVMAADGLRARAIDRLKELEVT